MQGALLVMRARHVLLFCCFSAVGLRYQQDTYSLFLFALKHAAQTMSGLVEFVMIPHGRQKGRTERREGTVTKGRCRLMNGHVNGGVG